jgi:preprotein translocase subunit SecF
MLNIVKYYKFWFGVSIVLFVAAIIAISVYGLKFGIDFKGGTITQLDFTQGLPNNDEIKSVLEEDNIHDAVVQPLEGNKAIIRTGPQEKEQHDAMVAKLTEKFGAITEDQFSSIGPTIGRELRGKAIYQLILVSLGIILYIAYAFRKVAKPVSSWRFGWAAIVALVHDLFIVIGVFALLGEYLNVEIDGLFVTALLTVLGFSVHDTIVVFDRIRENLRVRAGQSLPDIINTSINQTLIRSINTSLTVIFVLTAMLLFGGETIKYFVLALLIGIIAGTYSSIFIASPLLLIWHKWDLRRSRA